jgi:hypothetical protein
VKGIRLSLAVALVLLCALAAPAARPAKAQAAAAACGSRIDIGVTVLSGGKIRGSGSYTSLACRPINSVYLVIQKGSRNVQHEIGPTRVTRRPSEPSSAKFSPRDYTCFGSSTAQYFKTKIKATYADGGTETKLSNYIIARCL